MQRLLEELTSRWESMFAGLAAGEDLPPSRRLRAEGLMEAAALLEPGSEEHITALMDDCYQRHFGRSLASAFGSGWRDFYPFPQIPAVMHRAPVVPSTTD